MRVKPKRIDILGIPLSVLASYEEAVGRIIDRIRRGQKTFCVALTPEKSYRAHKDDELKQIIQVADLHICDGIGMAIAASILHGRRVTRVTGVDLFERLVARAEMEGLSVFLLGARPESNAGAAEMLQARHPALRIVGRQHGYIEDDVQVVEKIRTSRPDMLFVAMGSPRQEVWVAQHYDRLDVPYCMGVGGSFDVVSGHARRAPRWAQKSGTEFLYRFALEPRRWKRELCACAFMLCVVRAKLMGSPRVLLDQ